MNSSTTILRSQVAAVLRRVSAEYAEEMLELAAGIARNNKAFDGDRLKAIGMILDRAAGKPTQEIADENFDPEVLLQKMREARAQAGEVMNPALPPPDDKPMGEVIELRPTKVEVTIPRRKITRRKLVG